MIRHPRIAMAVALVAAEFGIDADDIYRQDRHKSVATARLAAMWVCRHLSKPAFSLPEIGHSLERDHSTVMAGVRSFERMRREDPWLAEIVTRVLETMHSPRSRIRVA